MRPLIDTHCHFEPEDDAAALLREAAENQVRAIAIGCSPELNETARKSGTCFANGYDWSNPCPGAPLEKLPGMVAVGELGFDFHYGYTTAEDDRQRTVFWPQADFARAENLPIIVHTREADETTMDCLSEADLPALGVIHSFTGSKEMARKFLDLGYYVSLSGIVTFRNADALREVAKYLPDDRILVETDCPYLAPVPLRGKRNHAAYVRYTADLVASLRGHSCDVFADITTANARRLFRLPEVF